MTYIPQTTDLSKQYNAYRQQEDTFRPVASATYTPGACVQFTSMDQQQYTDVSTVQLSGTAANQQLIIGLVSNAWPGFNGSIGAASYTAPSNVTTVRGTQGVDVITAGFHPGGLVDQSGTGAAAVTNGTPLIASRATAGYMQGVSTAVAGLGTAAIAMLPASGLGSNLTAAALVQASQTDTLSGVPAQGDVLSVTLQMPYNTTSPGIAQTMTFTAPALTSAQAASVTTAAAALVAYLNGNPSFSQFFVASNAAGVVTIAVNTAAALFTITNGSNGALTNQYQIALSGSAANGLTFSVATVSGATVSTAGGSSLAGGAGYKGPIPCWVC